MIRYVPCGVLVQLCVFRYTCILTHKHIKHYLIFINHFILVIVEIEFFLFLLSFIIFFYRINNSNVHFMFMFTVIESYAA